MLRIVVDTNVLVSGLFWQGLPAKIYNLVTAQTLKLVSSDAQLQELSRVLQYPKFSNKFSKVDKTREGILESIRLLAEIANEVEIPPNTVRDPKDQIILACAVGGQVDYIVTGDQDLLILRAYEGIPIITALDFLSRVENSNG
jgi:hypothetical protein